MDPFVGQIMMFGGNFPPRGWALCNGQLLAISSNDALFSLLGTMYGGDGRTTFALPDLRGMSALGMGHGPGLSDRRIGARVGAETVTLSANEMPSHAHQLSATNTAANTSDPSGATIANENVVVERGAAAIPVNGYSNIAANAAMGSTSIANSGGSQAHVNMQPSIAMNYVIALQGVYPSRS